jgi:hypothetical protein
MWNSKYGGPEEGKDLVIKEAPTSPGRETLLSFLHSARICQDFKALDVLRPAFRE